MNIQKPRCEVEIEIPNLKSRTTDAIVRPAVIDCKWSKNSYLEADALTITVSWQAGGIEPRYLRNATATLWMWDDAIEPYNEEKHKRFIGVCVKAERKVSNDGYLVDMTFHDYTSFFIHMKPFPTAGMPEWKDTLPQIWAKICDNVGFYKPAEKKILSSVSQFRDRLVFKIKDPAKLAKYQSATLGDVVNPRMHEISKPTPKNRTDAWAVWNYCCTSLGLISYIDKDVCVVSDGPTYFDETNAARFMYGDNIFEFHESVDSNITNKGVVVKSFDPLTGRALEAFYPHPGDERLKLSKATAKRRAKAGTDITPNDESQEWIPFDGGAITNQEKLDELAELIYDQQSRQHLEGSLKTSDTTVYDANKNAISILDLVHGDAVHVGVTPYARDKLLGFADDEARSRYLQQTCGYDPGLAQVIVKNIIYENFASQIFHVSGFEASLGVDHFDVEIKYISTLNFTDDAKRV